MQMNLQHIWSRLGDPSQATISLFFWRSVCVVMQKVTGRIFLREHLLSLQIFSLWSLEPKGKTNFSLSFVFISVSSLNVLHEDGGNNCSVPNLITWNPAALHADTILFTSQSWNVRSQSVFEWAREVHLYNVSIMTARLAHRMSRDPGKIQWRAFPNLLYSYCI